MPCLAPRSLPEARNAAIEAPASNPDWRREPLVSAFPGGRLETREGLCLNLPLVTRFYLAMHFKAGLAVISSGSSRYKVLPSDAFRAGCCLPFSLEAEPPSIGFQSGGWKLVGVRAVS